jgi:DNA-binding XRE family transcriptional regulator
MAVKNLTIRKLRNLCELSQDQLAQMVDCARLTIHGLEAGKLKLSPKMAIKIACHTGVSPDWLLANDPRTPPVCHADPAQPYTREVYARRRAEVLAARTASVDLVIISNFLKIFCSRLRGCASAAYQSNEIIYFNFQAREFLEKVEERWNMSKETALTEREFEQQLRKDAAAKNKRTCQHS